MSTGALTKGGFRQRCCQNTGSFGTATPCSGLLTYVLTELQVSPLAVCYAYYLCYAYYPYISDWLDDEYFVNGFVNGGGSTVAGLCF